MTGASQYQDDFLRHMAPVLADEYRRWYPFCREAVLATVEHIGSRESLASLLGESLPDDQYALLREAWFEPYRSYHTRSGKLIRPFLVCFCMRAYGRDPLSAPALVATAEIIHAASLVLDDIADDSPLRRGGPTAHRQVGVRVAGAAASAWLNACFDLLDGPRSGLDADARGLLLGEIAWEHWVTGLGTTIDTSWPWLGRFDGTPQAYLQSVVHRSTSYTYRLPLKLGAIAAGASRGELAQFAAFGEELGLAFQIVDDILNVRPGDAHWGKALAEDVTQGKITLQVLLALAGSGAAERARLIAILQSRTQDAAVLSEAVELIGASGALEAARRIADRHVSRTKEIAAHMDFLPATDRELLAAFVDYVVTRSR